MGRDKQGALGGLSGRETTLDGSGTGEQETVSSRQNPEDAQHLEWTLREAMDFSQ